MPFLISPHIPNPFQVYIFSHLAHLQNVSESQDGNLCKLFSFLGGDKYVPTLSIPHLTG